MNIKYLHMNATLSPDEYFRFSLTRAWINTKDRDYHRSALFIMLNPSTANNYQDDPTVKRCVNIADTHDCDRLTIVNLFPFITPIPKVLMKWTAEKLDQNDAHIRDALEHTQLIICAWGSLVKDEILRSRAREVLKLIHVPTFALHINKDGNPKHPLYCKSDSKLVLFDKNNY